MGRPTSSSRRAPHVVRRSWLLLLVPALTTASPASAATGTILLQREDAYVASEGQDSTWTVGNSAIAYSVGFDETGRLTTRDLKNGAGLSWNPTRQADTNFQIDGR